MAGRGHQCVAVNAADMTPLEIEAAIFAAYTRGLHFPVNVMT